MSGAPEFEIGYPQAGYVRHIVVKASTGRHMLTRGRGTTFARALCGVSGGHMQVMFILPDMPVEKAECKKCLKAWKAAR